MQTIRTEPLEFNVDGFDKHDETEPPEFNADGSDKHDETEPLEFNVYGRRVRTRREDGCSGTVDDINLSEKRKRGKMLHLEEFSRICCVSLFPKNRHKHWLDPFEQYHN